MQKSALVVMAAGCLLTACGIATKPYKGYSAETPIANRVTLECDGICGVIKNLDSGQRIDARYREGWVMNEGIGQVTLDPGRYNIELLQHGKINPWDTIVYETYGWTAEPGHAYLVRTHYVPDWFGSNGRHYMWIEDGKTGQVVAGYSPP